MATGRQWAAWAAKLGAVALAVAFLGAVPGAEHSARAGDTLEFEAIHGTSGPQDDAAFVATTQDEWTRIWDLIGQAPPRPLTEGEETGVALFMGARPSGGYGYKIRRVEVEDGRMEVKATLFAPAGAAPQGDTAPYVVLLIRGAGHKTILDLREELTPMPAPE